MKSVLKILQGKQEKSPPVWFMRQAGRYLPEYGRLKEKAGGSFWDLCLKAEYAAEITLQPLQRFPLDAAIVFSDILIIPHALGQTVHFETGRGPVLAPLVWETLTTSLKTKSYLKTFTPTLEALQRVRSQLSSTQTLLGFSGTPWTLLAYMLNSPKDDVFQAFRGLSLERQEGLLSLLTEVVGEYLQHQIQAGADALQLFDSWAHLVPEAHRQRVLFAPVEVLYQKIRKKHPHFPLLYFGKGLSHAYGELSERCPHLAFSFDQYASVTDMVALQKRTTVQGNLDPLLLVKGGEALEKGVRILIEMLGKGPYIFNLGHGVLPQTPPEHVGLVCQWVKEASKEAV